MPDLTRRQILCASVAMPVARMVPTDFTRPTFVDGGNVPFLPRRPLTLYTTEATVIEWLGPEDFTVWTPTNA